MYNLFARKNIYCSVFYAVQLKSQSHRKKLVEEKKCNKKIWILAHSVSFSASLLPVFIFYY